MFAGTFGLISSELQLIPYVDGIRSRPVVVRTLSVTGAVAVNM